MISLATEAHYNNNDRLASVPFDRAISVHNPRGMQVLGSIPNKGTVFSKCFLAEAESLALSKTFCLEC